MLLIANRIEMEYAWQTDRRMSLNLFMENSHHPYVVRVYSGKTRIDRIQLPSGKKFHLYSIPYYLLSRIDDVIERFVARICGI